MLMGFFDGFAPDVAKRTMIISNVTIYEKFEYHLYKDWYDKLKPGLEERLQSKSLGGYCMK